MNGWLQILFARPPVPGKVKTRLAAFLGPQGAATLYRRLLEHSLRELRQPDVALEIHSATGEDRHVLEALASGLQVRVQAEGDLGARMAHALCEAAAPLPDETPVILCGTDIPGYGAAIGRQSAALLSSGTCVLGPTNDGGYYLVGMLAGDLRNRDRVASVFEGIAWSSEQTRKQQEEQLRALGFSVRLAPELCDIDTFDDFAQWKEEPGCFARDLFPDLRVILPVLNEEESLPGVLRDLFKLNYFREIICADNGSSDASAQIAAAAGATVTHCPERGYGATCLAALDHLRRNGGCDVVLFADADGADDPASIPSILSPVVSDEFDLALAARRSDLAESGALQGHQRLGNRLVTALVRLLYGFPYQDLGPLRAIRWQALERLHMEDRNYGWTVEMQIRAVREGLRIQELPVAYRRRQAGRSKVSSTFRGSLRAGQVILQSVILERLRPWPRHRSISACGGGTHVLD